MAQYITNITEENIICVNSTASDVEQRVECKPPVVKSLASKFRNIIAHIRCMVNQSEANILTQGVWKGMQNANA